MAIKDCDIPTDGAGLEVTPDEKKEATGRGKWRIKWRDQKGDFFGL